MRQRIIALGLALGLALGMTPGTEGRAAENTKNRYQVSWMDLFDTVTTVLGYAESEDAFNETADRIYDELKCCDRLYDIYNEYPETVNLCTVNGHPGETFEVDQRIIDLLIFAKEADDFSGHRTNAMLGSVLKIWHEAREAGIENPETARLPENAELEAASRHTGFDLLEMDPDARTVRLTDPEASLDVGALAKGYAVQRVCEFLPEGWLISAGGNVAATGPKPDGSPWVIGVQNPDDLNGGFLHKVNLTAGAVVTSGDYQRMYVVDGVSYHHIIDPETLFPAGKWRAVTVIAADSGLADALSTSLFLMDQAEGQALLERFGAEAVWIRKDGTQLFSPGYEAYIRP